MVEMDHWMHQVAFCIPYSSSSMFTSEESSMCMLEELMASVLLQSYQACTATTRPFVVTDRCKSVAAAA